MSAKPRTAELISSLSPAASSGSIVKIDGTDWYKISNYDSIPPFFMTITSSSDVWNFIWSTGALSAGRKDANQAVFPYYTADKINDMRGCTGSYSAVKFRKGSDTFFWEPFADCSQWKVERNIYKNSAGSHIIFEEVNTELSLTYKVEWTSSEKFGLVRIASIENNSSEKVSVQILDGAQNIMPASVPNEIQAMNSVLVDAYKKSDVDLNSGLALFSMSSVLTDRAEPSESLWANTAWFSKKLPVYLSPACPDLFSRGKELEEIQVLKGERSSCFISFELNLEAGSNDNWYQVFDTKVEISKIETLHKQLCADRNGVVQNLLKDIAAGKELLDKYVGGADGIQNTADVITCMHHKANVMFNIMRGGVFVENNNINGDDFVDFVKTRNASLQLAATDLVKAGSISYSRLGEDVAKTNNPQLYRLYLEYLPLSFSRRHGDPSRPWNKFSINLKDTLGNPILNYEGNWRDIFQNWEALAMSYPVYTTGMIAKFLNAVTIDGFNPYRITRNGLDWEIPEPNNPWANIGYWNDHQVIYLCKLLELENQINPSELTKLLTQAVFSTSNVPYRIKGYDDILKNPRDTIVFDRELNGAIVSDTKKYGTDSKLVGKDGNPYLVNLSAKLLQLILTKLANAVPGGGIWLNTQRPEWNDANNALAGYGLSMVTLCYLRRMLVFCKKLFASSEAASFEIPSTLKKFFDEIKSAYSASPDSFGTGALRRDFVEHCGRAFEAERNAFYKDGSLLTKTEGVTKDEILVAFDSFIAHCEYSIRLNKRADGLYHSYNTLAVSEDGMDVNYLQEMLEGQVAVLSSGLLSPEEAIDLMKSLRASRMYEKRQKSYMLYPTKELPMFVQKNSVSKAKALQSPLLSKELERGYTAPDADCIVYNDSIDSRKCHFNPDFRNAELLSNKLSAVYKNISDSERKQILELYEETFNHKSFTGRSGTFYAYEGIGSIYWHMVSKLLLAVQENFFTALHAGNTNAASALSDIYYEVRSGLSFNKTPEIYGAFPVDPYSHTPWQQGAKQPGMTGQVKEEVITRWGELGMEITGGRLSFNPALLSKKEFDSEGKLSFTRFGVPFEYRLNDSINEIRVTVDGQNDSATLSEVVSKGLFSRSGGIRNVVAEIPACMLYKN